MFQKELLGSSVNKQDRRRTVTVRFFKEENVFNEQTQLNEVKIVEDFVKDFLFSIDESVEVMKARVQQYLDELNFVPTEITDLDYVEPTEPTKTAAELEKEEWDKDRAQLATVMGLVRDGVFTGTEKKITDLQAKVKAGFKTSYLNSHGRRI